jgi:hypothetical protein
MSVGVFVPLREPDQMANSIRSFLHVHAEWGVWLSSKSGAESSALCGANHEGAAGRLDHVIGDHAQVVNSKDALDLGSAHETEIIVR